MRFEIDYDGSLSRKRAMDHITGNVTGLTGYTADSDWLRKRFFEEWKGSLTSFAKKYNVNQASFSRWANGKREHNSSKIAVLSYLNGYNERPEPNTKSSNLISKNKVLAYEGERIFFIDGDNKGEFVTDEGLCVYFFAKARWGRATCFMESPVFFF